MARSSDRLFMWAGGKARMLARYEPLLPAAWRAMPYVEPFAGGAALFARVRPELRAPALLADVNAEVMGLYRAVRDDPEALILRVAALEARWALLDKEGRRRLYYDLRKRYWSTPDGPEATALLYFLMRTAFNGVWQTCVESRGRFGTPVGLAVGKDRVFDAVVVRRWSSMLQGVALHAGGYETTPIPRGAFVFCDPPYRGSFATYGVSFDDAAHMRLASWCRDLARRGCVVWLANRDTGDGFLEHVAQDATIHRFPVTYTAGRRRRTERGFEACPAVEALIVWRRSGP